MTTRVFPSRAFMEIENWYVLFSTASPAIKGWEIYSIR
jgi:hypothetical protein